MDEKEHRVFEKPSEGHYVWNWDGMSAVEDCLGEAGRDQKMLRLLGCVNLQAIVVVDSM